ncbi:DnaJ family domain-containing protein [Xylanibacillus composti]|nr:DnaJ family domain-containing protein [Xylanibacillus composti]
MDAIVEEKIREAMEKGDFDQLPGSGKPLPPDDAAGVPPELRLGFKLLKNAGMLPEEMQLRKELITLEELLACCKDESERSKLRDELSVKRLRYEALMGRRGWQSSEVYAQYGPKMREKLTASDE